MANIVKASPLTFAPVGGRVPAVAATKMDIRMSPAQKVPQWFNRT